MPFLTHFPSEHTAIHAFPDTHHVRKKLASFRNFLLVAIYFRFITHQPFTINHAVGKMASFSFDLGSFFYNFPRRLARIWVRFAQLAFFREPVLRGRSRVVVLPLVGTSCRSSASPPPIPSFAATSPPVIILSATLEPTAHRPSLYQRTNPTLPQTTKKSSRIIV